VIDVALGREATAEVDVAAAMIAGGRLTTVELRAILPWLMRQRNLTTDRSFWSRLGDLFDLGMLEEVAGDLSGVDLSRLVRANASKWTARRSYLGLALDNDEAPSSSDGTWRFQGGVLGVDFGGQRIMVATSGRTLPGRDSVGSPLWEDLALAVEPFRVVAATLRGVTRSIPVTAEESDDVKSDIAGVVSSMEDSFRVGELTVRVADQPSGEPADIEVSFSRGIATATPSATVRDLVRTAGELVAFREPLAEEGTAIAVSDEV
jgi:hypothetical protein